MGTFKALVRGTSHLLLSSLIAMPVWAAGADDFNAAGVKLRGDGSVDDNSVKSSRVEHEKAHAHRISGVEHAVRAERLEKAGRPEKTERVEKAERAEKAERVEKAERPEKAERVEKVERVEKTERPEKVEKVERTEKAERPEKVEKRG